MHLLYIYVYIYIYSLIFYSWHTIVLLSATSCFLPPSLPPGIIKVSSNLKTSLCWITILCTQLSFSCKFWYFPHFLSFEIKHKRKCRSARRVRKDTNHRCVFVCLRVWSYMCSNFESLSSTLKLH